MLALAACGAPPGGGRPGTASPVPWHSDGDPNRTEATSLPSGDVDGPSGLKGLTAGQVRSVLGSPNFRRRDNPAEIWQYRGNACTLDLFLYDEEGRQTVSHWAVRSQNGVGDRDCFVQLTTAH
ncbi:MAG: hypothetical protein ACM31L_20725 [Actinomycetota bacterium]